MNKEERDPAGLEEGLECLRQEAFELVREIKAGERFVQSFAAKKAKLKALLKINLNDMLRLKKECRR